MVETVTVLGLGVLGSRPLLWMRTGGAPAQVGEKLGSVLGKLRYGRDEAIVREAGTGNDGEEEARGHEEVRSGAKRCEERGTKGEVAKSEREMRQRRRFNEVAEKRTTEDPRK